MKQETHIADILNTKLRQLGSTLDILQESNDIGEQIASLGVEDRFVEIIRVREEKEIWVSFYCDSVFLPSADFSDITEVANIIFEFLALKISVRDFLNTYCKSPIDISNLASDDDILLELYWFYFLQPSKYDMYDSKKWLIVVEFAKTIESIAKVKKLNPYRSIDRLCFTLDRRFNTGNFPCIWFSSREKDISIFSIGYYDGTKLQSGTAEEIQNIFKELILSET
ncbi:MAG: hypothetical protein AAF611_05530 [Bacteroidota bacterium]